MAHDPRVLDISLIEIAYKKLKSSVYYDKTLAILRDDLVAFENEGVAQLQSILDALSGTSTAWQEYEEALLEDIDYLAFPKKLVDAADENETLLINERKGPPKIAKYQYHIDLKVQGHILGVLWLMTIGKAVDDQGYEHSYGNRLHAHLYNSNNAVTYSPNLFKPYIQQYGSWRDLALRLTQEKLDHQDMFIITLDFKSYFYSLNLNKDKFDQLVAAEEPGWISRVHAFVWHVIERYSTLLSQKKVVLDAEKPECMDTKRNFLPIGFLPSNVLSNWALQDFDRAITDRWNPVYYGRYVDDIIIVDKVERNSQLHKQVHSENTLTTKKIIQRFLCSCRNVSDEQQPCQEGCLIEDENNGDIYHVNNEVLGHDGSAVTLQSEKIKAFYFAKGASKALLTRFQEDIAHNISEFRVLPELDDALQFGNYNDIYEIKRDDTLNKLRGVKGIALDRFKLSKFLGKYAVIRSMISVKDATKFERDLFCIFDKEAIISHFTLWERLLEILVIGKQWNKYAKMVKMISDTIKQLIAQQDDPFEEACAQTLLRFLQASVNRSSSLCWDEKFAQAMEKYSDIQLDQNMRNEYLFTRMANKAAIPVMPDALLNHCQKNPFTDADSIDFTDLQNLLGHLAASEVSALSSEKKVLYPYWVKPQEISFACLCETVAAARPLPCETEWVETIDHHYWKLNYYTDTVDERSKAVEAIQYQQSESRFAVHIDTDQKEKLSVAIANARIKPDAFEQTLRKESLMSYDRYRHLCKIVDEAIRERSDLLVLPELYLPVEWLPAVARKCAETQMAMVVGLDFMIGGKKDDHKSPVYNLTAVVLPYRIDDQKHAYISYHHKVHYAPKEMELIRKYGYEPMQGKQYQLYSWHDVWFPVYCCFELACIQDRAIFHSAADMIVGVEWNADILYYGHIGHALSRDLYCYVIEANTSQYGGSGIIRPTSSEESELIRTKGGDNSSILTAQVDIQALRNAQFPEVADRKPFKPLPPITNRDYIDARYRGYLWQKLKAEKQQEE